MRRVYFPIGTCPRKEGAAEKAKEKAREKEKEARKGGEGGERRREEGKEEQRRDGGEAEGMVGATLWRRCALVALVSRWVALRRVGD